MGTCFAFVNDLELQVGVEVDDEIPHKQTEFSYLIL